MAELTAFEILTLVITGAGAGVTAIGEQKRAEGEAAAQVARGQQAQRNAIIARTQAEDARARGAIEVADQQTRSRLLLGTITASAAGAGILVNEDSIREELLAAAEETKRDELTVASNAEREALGFEQQAINYETSGQLLTTQAGFTRTTGALTAAGTAAVGLGTVSDRWYTYKTA
jgi:hypothetical protein